MSEISAFQTCWLLSQGSYSDYSVYAVVASKEEAQRIMDAEKAISGDTWSQWNKPEERPLLTDAGSPEDVLSIFAYHKNPESMESHRTQWSWDQYHKTPPVEGWHITADDCARHKHRKLGLGAIASAAGTDHQAVRKAFSEHKTQAIAILTAAGEDIA